jgi:preprotein translocase subunit SecD
MQQRHVVWLIITILLVSAALYVVLPTPGIHINLGNLSINKDFSVKQGLDLQGGLSVLLQADVADCGTLSDEAMNGAKSIVETRVNALGLTEPLVQRQGACRITVELPGISDPQQAVDTIKQTALLEFVDVGSTPLDAGTPVTTDCADPSKVDCGASTAGLTPTATVATTATVEATTTTVATEAAGTAAATTAPGAAPAATEPTPTGPTYHTVMTGAGLSEASARFNPNTGRYEIDFTLTSDGSRVFGAHTASHLSQYLAIVLDKTVISAPQINAAITDQGTISGSFNQVTSNQLALQLRSGALPVPLKIVTSREVGPSLGQDSVQKSILAGIIGVTVIAFYMIAYYRVPGIVAVAALLVYGLITFALFVLIPVTLTLPGIAGFVLSLGVALDANVLIFERMKEELRGGRQLRQAVDTGFGRAWSSIRDSNVSTLITCGILYWFGGTFGASIVKGFALTLALGVGVSLFTAITVTRSILHLVLDRVDFSTRHAWFGI